MKSFLFFVVFMSYIALVSAQVNVTLHMTQQLAGQPFAFNQPVVAEMGYAYNVTRLEYYISEINLIHDGGMVTPVTDLYLLVDPAENTTFELGSFDLADLEQIQFSIGVDSAHNHLDPSSYPSDHALAPKNPSMHWGWTAGYRFIALEGFGGSDKNSITNNYQVHTIGNVNYQIVLLDVDEQIQDNQMQIRLLADYAYLLDEIDVSSGLISHSTNGASKKIAENTRLVFSAPESTAVLEPGLSGYFSMLPNPAKDFSNIKYDLPDFEQGRLTVSDLTGRIVYTTMLTDSNASFRIETPWPSGLYIARIESNGRLLANEKLVIQ